MDMLRVPSLPATGATQSAIRLERTKLRLTGRTMPQERFDALPADALDAVSCFLTGWDLFQLSHTNSQCWNHFSRSAEWRRRLPRLAQQNGAAKASCNEAKRAYVQARSFMFDGLRLEERLSHGGGTDGVGAVVEDPVTGEGLTDTFTSSSSFAMDMWFSLLDGEHDGVLTGGVLLGGQSPLISTCMWTNHHVAFVAVDADRNLFCSILDGDANCVAINLDVSRWYHLALSYVRGTQRVHLNGELVSELEGQLYASWHELSRVQVGTGFVSSFWRQKSRLQLDRSPRTFCGWHNFYGIVDEVRVWSQPLCLEEIQELSRLQGERMTVVPWYSLKDLTHVLTLKRVACSRPLEHVVQVHKKHQAEWSLLATLLRWRQNFHEWL
ncbi:unnamed protein product [Phytophthora lilii]|uniref:Unnamed protein product n=1 Tax=Phytophthora lilii TaxID=2077276 RepID=A0A9W6TCX7_9STRA|nr:unnamed protein product [Phytophthora lilii]